MPKPMVIEEGMIRKVLPVIPETPDEIATYIREATNYVAYIEDKWLTKLVYEKDTLKDQISAIQAGIEIRRNEYIGKNFEEIPKELRKTATSIAQYVDYNVNRDATLKANEQLRGLKRQLSETRNKITAWKTAKEQYERSIQSSTMVLAWAKASLKLGGSNY